MKLGVDTGDGNAYAAPDDVDDGDNAGSHYVMTYYTSYVLHRHPQHRGNCYPMRTLGVVEYALCISWLDGIKGA